VRTSTLHRDRLIRPVLLDASIYREVARDPHATVEAGLAVLLTTLAYAIGHLTLGVQAAAMQFVGGAVIWGISVVITYYLATVETPGLVRTSKRRAVRTLAFANVPRGLTILLLMPVLGAWIAIAATALTVLAYAQAIDEVFDVDRQAALSIAAAANIPAIFVAILVLLTVL
jgi:hypothetical protein